MSSASEIAFRRIQAVNPATGEVLRELECADSAHVQESVRRARLAQNDWQAISLKQRLAVIKNFQRLVNERKSQIAQTITSEAGKPIAEALLTEVLVVLDAARFLLNSSHAFLQPTPVPHGSIAMLAKKGRLIREPHGRRRGLAHAQGHLRVQLADKQSPLSDAGSEQEAADAGCAIAHDNDTRTAAAAAQRNSAGMPCGKPSGKHPRSQSATIPNA